MQQNSSSRTGAAVQGVDIGAGYSCIYPLLGTKIAGWSFLGTDIDPLALEYAASIIERNKLQDKIQLRLAKEGSVLDGVLSPDESFDFCMCNPPFFETLDDTGLNPVKDFHQAGSANELVTDGGEVAFVSRIIEDSLILRHQIRWYTSMLGRKVSLKPLKEKLHSYGITNIRLTEFIQGRTTRWGIAWSFTDEGKDELLKTHAAARAAKRPRTEVALKPAKPASATFSVDGPQASALLVELQKGLEELGAKVIRVDKNTFCLKAQVEIKTIDKASHGSPWKNGASSIEEPAVKSLKSSEATHTQVSMDSENRFNLELLILQMSKNSFVVQAKEVGAGHRESFLGLISDLQEKVKQKSACKK
mmetsp:Transcript_39630/g.64246  ORF Transcript_39630/g.64246 Transcript_39630/m.64246 type:complete len:361 (+) Transcript_39630:268-1350(+)